MDPLISPEKTWMLLEMEYRDLLESMSQEEWDRVAADLFLSHPDPREYALLMAVMAIRFLQEAD